MPGRPTIPILTAAVCLACSWCWVIGMVLPIFLIADFGFAGWVAFVLPNVVGAASVGFVLRNGGAAARFLGEQRAAMRVFSLVTLAFHGFVIAHLPHWMGVLDDLAEQARLSEAAAHVAALVVAGLGVAMLTRFAFERLARLAWGVLAVSVVSFVLAAVTTSGDAFVFPTPDETYPFPAVLLAAPALALGFLTCPYLDRTLVRVRAEVDAPDGGGRGRMAFAVGFAGPFLALVLMTALYATGMLGTGVFSYWVLLHIFVQAVYTSGLHARAMRDDGVRTWASMTAMLVGGAVGLVIEHRWFDDAYQGFLWWYALPFPAFVVLLVVWARRVTRGVLIGAGFVVAAATPAFVIGQFESRWGWLAVGVGIVLCGPLVVRLIEGRGEATKGETEAE
jgi:hypothetical protein